VVKKISRANQNYFRGPTPDGPYRSETVRDSIEASMIHY